jgi:peptidoglycan/xylan/chitin deacetylase (PgdA/CDA1 family)
VRTTATSRAGIDSPVTQAPPSEAEQRAAVERFAAKGLPLFGGGGRAHYVAVTFDDGPSRETEQLVGVLAGLGCRATFFDVGDALARTPELARAQTTVGTVANHSWSHPHFAGLEDGELEEELVRTQAVLEEHLGSPPQGRLLRPPYGEFDDRTLAGARAMKMLTVLWNVDPEDWRDAASAEAIVEQTLDQLVPGGIVLLHDGIYGREERSSRETIEATRGILLGLRERGYEAVTVPELLVLDPPTDRQLEAGQPGFLGDRRVRSSRRRLWRRSKIGS